MVTSIISISTAFHQTGVLDRLVALATQSGATASLDALPPTVQYMIIAWSVQVVRQPLGSMLGGSFGALLW